jgi:chemotaxis protein methyltransferase CheR
LDREVTSQLDTEIDLLLEAIVRTYHYDFRSYAQASLKRRLDRARLRFDCATISELQGKVLRDPKLFADLLRFLTVQVSDLFRDPPYYLALRERVVPYLRTYPSLKIWVAGCATGEEAYSLAILLAEEQLLDRAMIYATDIHPESLRIAEEGVYDLARFTKFSESYQRAGGRGSLSDFYTAQYSHAIFDRALRKAILFSDHSLATDSVFAEVQLVSCRNVLIYFERDLQDRAIGILRDSLCRRGFLGLGSRESLRFSAHASSFVAFDQPQRIYQRC